MLIPYRSTSHPATGVALYKALPPVRTKLDYIEPEPQRNEKDDIIDPRVVVGS